MSKITDLIKSGVMYKPLSVAAEPAKEEDGDFMRGLKTAGHQIPQTLGGAVALAGDAIGSEGMREYGMDVYDGRAEKIQALSKESDSLSNVLENDESAVDWAQHSAGYVAGQAATAVLTGGVGGFIGKQLAKRGIQSVVDRGAKSAIAKEVAEKVARRGAMAGAGTAMFGQNLVQEAGSIYPEAAKLAEEEGRELTGGDLARVGIAAGGAAFVDTAMDAVMLGRVMSGGRRILKNEAGEEVVEGMGRAAAREVPLAMGREAVTEGIQTGIERWGAQKELGTADAIREYVDSMGVGAMGGGLGGGLSVLHAQKLPDTGPLSRAANTSIDQQILQLQYDPQPLISFPDGSVGHKQDLEAYLTQFADPEERTRKRRELMGRDPETGKRPEPPPEPTAADNDQHEAQNMTAWGARHEPVTLDYAQALIGAPGAKGQDLMIVPHPKGKGYTVMPSKWLTLHSQATYAALQKGDEGMLPGPDREAPGGAIRVDAEGEAGPETYGEQVRTAQRQREQQAEQEAEAARQQEVGKQTPKGGVILTPKGQPFASMFAAKLKQADGGLVDTHEIKPVDGGFVLQPKGASNADNTVLAQNGGAARAPGGAAADPAGQSAAGGSGADAAPLGAVEGAAAAPVEPADAPDIHAAGSADADPALIEQAAHEAATSPLNDLAEPTPAQKEAGNYKKGHVKLHGLDIAIENPAGSTRRGVDKAGKPWENELAHHYGYIKKTTGADGDHVDAFIGPKPASDRAFIVDQVDPDTGAFDEHKIVLGAETVEEAREIYQANYAKGWKGAKAISETSVEGFKTWLNEGDTTKPYAPQSTDQQAASGVLDAKAGSSQPAPVEPDAHAGKWFGTEAKARDYLAKHRIDKTHTVKPTGRARFDVVRKDAPAADWRAKVDDKEAKLADQLATANENTEKRKAKALQERDAKIAEKGAKGAALPNATAPEPGPDPDADSDESVSTTELRAVPGGKEGEFVVKLGDEVIGGFTIGKFGSVKGTSANREHMGKVLEIEALAKKASEAKKAELDAENAEERQRNEAEIERKIAAEAAAAQEQKADSEALAEKASAYWNDASPATRYDALLSVGFDADAAEAAKHSAWESMGADVRAHLTRSLAKNNKFAADQDQVAEAEAEEPADTGADIPKAFFKKVKVNVDVWIESEGRFETEEFTADKALKSVREDIANLQALLKCMKG